MDEAEEVKEPSNPELVDAQDALPEFHGSPKQMLQKYNHCSLCGSNLHFTYMTDFSKNVTQETARCPECGIKMRRLLHKLQ